MLDVPSLDNVEVSQILGILGDPRNLVLFCFFLFVNIYIYISLSLSLPFSVPQLSLSGKGACAKATVDVRCSS